MTTPKVANCRQCSYPIPSVCEDRKEENAVLAGFCSVRCQSLSQVDANHD